MKSMGNDLEFDLEDGSLRRRNEVEKIFRFSKNWFLWDKTYISPLPTLRRIQKYTFSPSFLTWLDRRLQNGPMIDDNSATGKYGKFLHHNNFLVVFILCLVVFIILLLVCLYFFIFVAITIASHTWTYSPQPEKSLIR